MNNLINRLQLFESKTNYSFGIINNTNFGFDIIDNLIIKYSTAKTNLLIIPKNIKKIINILNSKIKYQFYRKNIKYKYNNIIITDNQIKNYNNTNIGYIFFINAEKLKLNDFNYKYDFLWILSSNPDLIYFNNNIFYQKILKNKQYNIFKKQIINNKKQYSVKLIYKNYLPSLYHQILFLNNKDIIKLEQKIIQDYKIEIKRDNICNICLLKKKLLNNKCCPQAICVSCKLINQKYYNKCPFCRKKYNNNNIIINFLINNKFIYIIPDKINISNINLNLIKYKKLNIKVENNNITILINKLNTLDKKIIIFNLNNKIINHIINKYLNNYSKLEILNFIPYYYEIL